MGFLPVFGRNGEIHGGYYTPKPGQLIALVQVFTFAGSTIWRSLCGFTHGGYVQASWRMTEEEIVSDFSEEHLVGLLITSCALSLQAYITLAKLVGSPQMADRVAETHQEIFGYREWHNQ